MREKLEQLGLRLTGDDFELSSGLRSPVRWEIEKLFWYSPWIQKEAIREWAWEVGRARTGCLVGIPTGGDGLAHLLSGMLSWPIGTQAAGPLSIHHILVDDVLTTGTTIKRYLARRHTTHIAVLINRSDPPLTEIHGVPIITGIFADPVSNKIGEIDAKGS